MSTIIKAVTNILPKMEWQQPQWKTTFSTHEDADIRMFFHLNHALPGSTVVMQTCNTDSLVIGCKHFFNTLEIWLEARVQGKNNLQFINDNSFYPELGETLCKALSAYYTLTGCHYTTSFFKKVKFRPLNFYKKILKLK